MNSHYVVITQGTLYLSKGSQKYKIQMLKSGQYKVKNITYLEQNTTGIRMTLNEVNSFFNTSIEFPACGVKTKKV